MSLRSYSVNAEDGGSFSNVGGITVAQAALGVTARAQADIDAIADTTKIVFDIDTWEAGLLRIRSDGSEDDSNVLQLYIGKQGDHYMNIGQLTCLQGTQEGGNSTYLADSITPASEKALFDGEELSVTNEMGLYHFRTMGFDRLVVIVSTLASTTVYVDAVRAGK